MKKIKEAFDKEFRRWKIALPAVNLKNRRRGSINKNGWTIHYLFGIDRGNEYMEYFTSHRMTNDTLRRIYEDGTVKLVNYQQVIMKVGGKIARKKLNAHNDRFLRKLKMKGLP